jgi:prepilin-type N-terminal cleavage/methylation domain-containing protein
MNTSHRSQPRRRSDGGFTLIEILIAIVLVGVLSAVVVVAIGRLTEKGASAACATSRDAATAGTNVYLTKSATYPTTLLQMTAASSGSLQLASNVAIDAAGTTASGPGWTLTMTPGVNGAPPTYDCSVGSTAANGSTTTTTPPNGTSACPGTFAGWVGEYYANQYMTGTPGFCRDDPTLSFNWASNGPGNGLPIWRFSARWTRTVVMTAGSHTFTLGSDDGSRLYIDGVLIIDWWTDHAPSFQTATVSLSAGSHLIVLEYYQYYGVAQASLTWT